jgi:CHASE1-domain containing sensor protein
MAKKKAAKTVKAIKEETARQRFVRLVNPRMNAAIKRIQLVGNLSASQYDFSEADVNAIEIALHTEVEAVLNRFRKVRNSSPSFEIS